jgi:hypothetical protein
MARFRLRFSATLRVAFSFPCLSIRAMSQNTQYSLPDAHQMRKEVRLDRFRSAQVVISAALQKEKKPSYTISLPQALDTSLINALAAWADPFGWTFKYEARDEDEVSHGEYYSVERQYAILTWKPEEEEEEEEDAKKPQ